MYLKKTSNRATEEIVSISHPKMLVGSEPNSKRRFFRRRPTVILVLCLSDVLLALLVWQLALVLHGVLGRGPLSDFALASIVPSVIAWLGLRAAMGLYPGYGLDQVEELRRQTYAVLTTLTVTAVFLLASQTSTSLSRILTFTWFLGLLLLAPVARYFTKRALAKIGLWGKPVVVLGAEQTGGQVLERLRREWQIGYRPVGVFDNRVAPATGALKGVPYGGTLTDAVTLARKHAVDTVIFAMPTVQRQHLAKFVDLANRRFRHVVVIPDLEGITNSSVVARDFAGTFGIEIRSNLLDPWAQRLKRALDLAATFVGGVLILPLIVILTLLVWMESRGPIFYRDLRMGRDGKLFSCIKFRTMVADAEELLQRLLSEDDELREEYLVYHKLRNDPRVTRIGRFLRKTSLDELPQLWNVVRGEMSLVGPRPYLPRESEDIGETQSEILRVTPGITGLWQVTGRNTASFAERVRMDAYYVRDWSIWLDVVLLARTVSSLLFSRSAY